VASQVQCVAIKTQVLWSYTFTRASNYLTIIAPQIRKGESWVLFKDGKMWSVLTSTCYFKSKPVTWALCSTNNAMKSENPIEFL
jgi:hypothetical protein